METDRRLTSVTFPWISAASGSGAATKPLPSRRRHLPETAKRELEEVSPEKM
jgi:hypothetical protein